MKLEDKKLRGFLVTTKPNVSFLVLSLLTKYIFDHMHITFTSNVG